MEMSQIIQRMLHAVSTVGVKYTFESLYNRQKLQLNPFSSTNLWYVVDFFSKFIKLIAIIL